MKTLKKFLFASVALALIFSFSACQDTIYSNIRKEVTLENGTVSGSINSIVRFTESGQEYIYISNGGSIYRKKNSNDTKDHRYGGWENMKPSGLGQYIVKLAADSTYLYAFSASWDENTKKGQNRWNGRAIHCSTDGKTWNKVSIDINTSSSGTDTDNAALFLFCTNTIANNNRKAYVNYAGKGYSLDGTTATEDASAKGKASCASLGGTVKFADAYGTYYGSAACTNETTTTAGTVYYYSNGATVKSEKGSTTSSVSAGSEVYSLACTKDFLLVGTKSGIKHFRLNDDGTIGSQAEFSTNADAVMTTSYEVNAILVVEPEKNETETAIYTALDFEGRTQQFDHICLWSYYPSRGNWNRD